MTTTKTISDIADEINDLLPSCMTYGGRKQGEFTPLLLSESGKRCSGFLSDWSGDCRTALYTKLRNEGWASFMYSAPYFWSVTKGGYVFEYIEGDLYLTNKQ